MKIVCVGRNYVEHAAELNNATPSSPVIFLKPDTALLKENKPFFIPDFSNNIQHEAEVVLRINRNGKNIEEQFAHKYYDQVTLGIDFTARDIQHQLKEKKLSWELAKGFDNSAPIGEFVPLTEMGDHKTMNFSLRKNDKVVQHGNTKDMIFSFEEIIAYVSKYITLRMGDLVFTGTPKGVEAVSIGDTLQGFINDRQVFEFKVK